MMEKSKSEKLYKERHGKTILVLLVAAVMAFGFTACSSGSTPLAAEDKILPENLTTINYHSLSVDIDKTWTLSEDNDDFDTRYYYFENTDEIPFLILQKNNYLNLSDILDMNDDISTSLYEGLYESTFDGIIKGMEASATINSKGIWRNDNGIEGYRYDLLSDSVHMIGFFTYQDNALYTISFRFPSEESVPANMVFSSLKLSMATEAPSTEQALVAEEPAVEPPAIEEPAVEDEELAPAMTVSQQQAVRKAQEYLNSQAFSKKGLIEQLEYEGFSNADAKFAVKNIAVDWNEQVAKKAQEYLDSQAFSRQGLIDQLIYEGFTKKQATFGVNSVGL